MDLNQIIDMANQYGPLAALVVIGYYLLRGGSPTSSQAGGLLTSLLSNNKILLAVGGWLLSRGQPATTLKSLLEKLNQVIDVFVQDKPEEKGKS